MKNLLLSCALLLALLLPVCSVAAGPPDIVVVRIWEGNNITAIITRGEGKSEKVHFNSGFSDKNLMLAGEGYHKLFAQLYGEGYVLQSTIPSQPTPSSSYVTLLFVKKP